MAALQLLGHAGLLADLGEIVGRLHVDHKAVLAQVGGVALAAAALRILVQRSLNRRGDGAQPAFALLVVDRVPASLPALAWTLGLQKRAARVGFDFTSSKEAAESVAEEARELATAVDARQVFEEMGDLLFAMVSLARRLKVNPEDALRLAGQRFRDRFAKTEAALREEGLSFRDMDQDELARRWDKNG